MSIINNKKIKIDIQIETRQKPVAVLVLSINIIKNHERFMIIKRWKSKCSAIKNKIHVVLVYVSLIKKQIYDIFIIWGNIAMGKSSRDTCIYLYHN